MVELAPGSVVRVMQPAPVVAYSSPSIVKNLWLKEGPTGPAGRSITSLERTSGTGAPGTDDTYTVTFSDGSTATFTVHNGSNGTNGRGIASVARTSGTGAPGTTDTYTITFNDATTTTFQVANGANGSNGTNGQGVPTGGTSGQVLAKTSGTDYATGWTTPLALGTTAATAAAGNRGLPAGGTAGQVLQKVNGTDYNVQWATASSGGGLLASASTSGTDFSTTSTTLVDVNAALAVTFTAPASGAVIVRLTAIARTSASTNPWWGLRDGTTTVTSGRVSISISGYQNCSAAFRITGLTAGATYTYKWAFASDSASVTVYVATGSSAIPATMEVLSA